MAHCQVAAPMPGFIREILVKTGDEVQEDDELMIIEAMKMENPILAPCGGVVKEIHVRSGEQIDAEKIVATIE